MTASSSKLMLNMLWRNTVY